MVDIFNYNPRHSHEVKIGQRPLGGDNPLRLQSMTTCATTDTMGCADQIERIVAAGADYVRLTTQGTIEAENLRNIRAELQRRGIDVPLVADVHFNPQVADVAATIVEKVRINPGNYVDPARTFRELEYTDEEYAAELQRLEARFKGLLDICRQHGTALRIGVNHGSLSDRIMSRYGDTPEGIVESCMEFLRVCVKEDFRDVVVSIKASNTVVMVTAVRQLCAAMEREGMDFPLHLGVTEAGEGEDGRIKSALGIGALLADGIGDTLRVSLSEEPEVEIPVAYKLASYVCGKRGGHDKIPATACPEFDYLHPQRRPTHAVGRIGGSNVPVVVSVDNEIHGDLLPDYVFCGKWLPPAPRRHEGVGYIVPVSKWKGKADTYPVFTKGNLHLVGTCEAAQKFLLLHYVQIDEEVLACLRAHREMVVLAWSINSNTTGELRAFVHNLWREGITNPVIMGYGYAPDSHKDLDDAREDFQIAAASDLGGVLIDGLADGIMLSNGSMSVGNRLSGDAVCATAYGILQAARLRVSKTEYISCPGCGRTLYDLQGTIARIKAATSHLTGLKIGIMGCIVNGPGEMADADYGYVGAARGKVSLYRGRTCVEKNIPEAEAVSRLLALIEADRGHTDAM